MLITSRCIFILSPNPAKASDTDPATFAPLAPCACPDQRSTWDILWSRLSTIFACSWVSVHPNVPGPKETRNWIVLQMIILWAMRQWFGARNLAHLWHEKGWTKTHGYFVQMGGFMLYEGSAAQGVLSAERLRALYEDGQIDFPTITEEEIKNRSKADAFAKTFVIGQTTWFIAQCLARGVQGLNLTELELVTVAFAFLNAFMYFLWWNKPLDVQSSAPVFLLATTKESPREVKPIALRSYNLVKDKGYFRLTYGILILGPARMVVLMFTRLDKMMETNTTTAIDEGQMRVATFYALHTVGLELRQILCIASIIAVAFGAIHCAGWTLVFPCRRGFDIADSLQNQLSDGKVYILQLVIQCVTTIDSARNLQTTISTLAGSVISLRALPPGALAAVKWTSFVPHI
ncbi:hypothetical protein CPB84DRAFT_1836761 [Gymnopilus junonius]|uniref:Uncharacterized protein n=1 Tax=Gymnopilus junonius TaxID=109634 RepID=A0A9P5NPR5_GYMJU|nr:hypothetical protein CPB84DRAFT_1836761 [Gymnopilus junonius]